MDKQTAVTGPLKSPALIWVKWKQNGSECGKMGHLQLRQLHHYCERHQLLQARFIFVRRNIFINWPISAHNNLTCCGDEERKSNRNILIGRISISNENFISCQLQQSLKQQNFKNSTKFSNAQHWMKLTTP